MLMNKMAINLSVHGPLVEDRIVGNMYGTSIVGIVRSRTKEHEHQVRIGVGKAKSPHCLRMTWICIWLQQKI